MDTLVEPYTDTPFDSHAHGYYATPELTQRLNLIRHLLQNSEQLLLVMAEMGVGKTCLLQQLQSNAAEHWWIYTLNSTPALSPESFLTLLLNHFNVRQTGKTAHALQDSLRSHIAAKRYNGQLPILLVDDAHMLPLATLKLIIELAMQGEPQMRLRVVLFCEPQITSILAAPEFALVHNTLIHSIDIPTLSKAQTREYIEFRLANSQYSQTSPFTNELIRRLHEQAEGKPEQLNQLAQTFLTKHAENPHAPTVLSNPSGPPNRWLWGGVLLLLLIGSGVLVRWKYPNMFESSEQVPTEVTRSVMLPLSEQPSLAELPATPNATASALPDLELPEVSPPNHAPPSALPEQPPIVTLLANENAVETPLVNARPSPELANPTLPTSSGDSLINPELLLTTEDIKDEEWLLSQHPQTYTLQVLGAHDPLTLKTFLRHHALKEVALFKTDYRERDWYVLLYGIYPDRSQAMLALQSLPTDLREATRPWPRTLASIQARIRKRLGLTAQ